MGSPAIFLGGPTHGADDWRQEAQELIHGIDPSIVVTSPQRGGPKVSTSGNHVHFDGDCDRRQASRYCNIALKSGAVAMWFPKRTGWPADGDYGVSEAHLLGRLEMNYLHSGLEFALGIDPAFSKARQFRLDIQAEVPGLPIYRSLMDVCLKSILYVHQKAE